MNLDHFPETANGRPSLMGPESSRAKERNEFSSWLGRARLRPGAYVLSTSGVRPLNPTASATSDAVRQVLKTEVAQAVARTFSAVRSSSDAGMLLRAKSVMTAMVQECMTFIDAFGVDNEDSLFALTRACMETIQTEHPGTGPAEVARTVMVQVVFGAQAAATERLRARKAFQFAN